MKQTIHVAQTLFGLISSESYTFLLHLQALSRHPLAAFRIRATLDVVLHRLETY
jgi:hypothetical protein